MTVRFKAYTPEDMLKVRQFISHVYSKLGRPNSWLIARFEFEIFPAKECRLASRMGAEYRVMGRRERRAGCRRLQGWRFLFPARYRTAAGKPAQGNVRIH